MVWLSLVVQFSLLGCVMARLSCLVGGLGMLVWFVGFGCVCWLVGYVGLVVWLGCVGWLGWAGWVC